MLIGLKERQMVLSRDTSKSAAQAQVKAWRSLGGPRRFRQAWVLSESVRRIAASGVRQRHPNYSDEQVRLAVVRLTLGLELFRRCFPSVEIEP